MNINKDSNQNVSSKISDSLTKSNLNNFKSYLNFVGAKNRIKTGAVSSQFNPIKPDLKTNQISSTNNILSLNVNNNLTSKNIRNISNNIFSSKHSTNNSDFLCSNDLKTEISNKFLINNKDELKNQANNIYNKNSIVKSSNKKNRNPETYRENLNTNPSLNFIQTNNRSDNYNMNDNGNLNNNYRKKIFTSRVDKKNSGNENNNLDYDGNQDKILGNFQNIQERNASANSRSRLKFYSPDSNTNTIKLVNNVSSSNKNKNFINQEYTNRNLNNNSNKLYNLTNSNFNNSKILSGKKILKKTFTIESKSKKSNENILNNNNNNVFKIDNLMMKKEITQKVNNIKKNFKLKDLFINSNNNTNNYYNNTNSNLNVNNFLTNQNILNSNSNLNTDNNILLIDKFNKNNHLMLNTLSNDKELIINNDTNSNENILINQSSKNKLLTSNMNNANNINNNNYNTLPDDQKSTRDMKITLNIKLNKNANDLGDIQRKLDISPFMPVFSTYENKMIDLKDANLGIKNFNININNNINFNQSNNPTTTSKILSARKGLVKKKPNTKSSSVPFNGGNKKEIKNNSNNLNSLGQNINTNSTGNK